MCFTFYRSQSFLSPHRSVEVEAAPRLRLNSAHMMEDEMIFNLMSDNNEDMALYVNHMYNCITGHNP